MTDARTRTVRGVFFEACNDGLGGRWPPRVQVRSGPGSVLVPGLAAALALCLLRAITAGLLADGAGLFRKTVALSCTPHPAPPALSQIRPFPISRQHAQRIVVCGYGWKANVPAPLVLVLLEKLQI
mgnify:CR=1 FL=1